MILGRYCRYLQRFDPTPIHTPLARLRIKSERPEAFIISSRVTGTLCLRCDLPALSRRLEKDIGPARIRQLRD